MYRFRPPRRLWIMLILILSFIPVVTKRSASGQTAVGAAEAASANATASPRQPSFSADGEDRWVVRAFYADRQMVDDLATWREPWEVHHDEGYVVLDVDRSEYERLRAAGFRLEMDERRTAALNRSHAQLETQTSGIPGYACYRTVEETYALAEGLATQHPELATWIDIGDSWEKSDPGGAEGYDLMVLRLTNGAVSGPKPKLFVMSSIHAREYTPAELNARFAEYLIDNYGKQADATWLLDYHEIHLLLQSNPDGRKHAETGLYWRKNTDNDYCTDTNSRGVDLNRNFAFQWSCCGGSSGNQCSEVYRGPHAGSEPETQAVQTYVRSQFPDLREDDLAAAAPITTTGVFLDIHSHSELVLWPWGFTATEAPNSTPLQTLGRKLAYFNGYDPSPAIDLYPTDGTTADFAYGELGVASFSFELGTAFFQDCATFENRILPDNLAALIYAARVARAPYMIPAGPDAVNPAVAPGVASPGQAVQLTTRIDDTRFSERNGSEPIQSIVAAEYTIDVPPWSTSPAPIAHPMTAEDGSFDTEIEIVEAAIDSTGLSKGRHTIFVRGRDASGNWGAVSATFLHITDPQTSPVIEGKVRSAADNAPLLATVSTEFSQANTDATGYYRMTVLSGTHDLQASAADYVESSVASVQVQERQTVRQDFYLFPTCTVISDDVESGNIGWTAEGNWSIVNEESYSESHSWTDSPGGTYGNNWDLALNSSVLDLSGYQGLNLSFWHRYDLETNYDFGTVEYSSDGGQNWIPLATYTGEEQTAWTRESLDLSALDGKANARIRFRLETDLFVTRDGWYIDDITLEDNGRGCLIAIAPAATFTHTGTITLGDSVTFTNLTTGTPPIAYAWDFGDGLGESTDSDPTYTYLSPGTFTATLTASNNQGVDSDSHPVVVAPVHTCTPVAIEALRSNGPVTLGGTTQLTATVTGQAPITFDWAFGDGTGPATAQGLASVSHAYAAAGTYSVTLEISNECPSEDSEAITVSVIPTDEAQIKLYLPIVSKGR